MITKNNQRMKKVRIMKKRSTTMMKRGKKRAMMELNTIFLDSRALTNSII
jgi:hypothetical protein